VNATLKALIVWLMLLAVPLQGFASATRQWCAPPSAVAQHQVAHHVDAHSACNTGDHHGGAHVSVTGDPACQSDHHGTPHHHPDGKCNTCATCCVGASMPPTFASSLPVYVPQFESIPFAPQHLVAPDLALPERPPRA
jgi:hypothetical protein